MKYIHVITTYIIGFVLMTFLFILHVPFWAVILISFIYFFSMLALPTLYTVYWSNNIQKIESYLKANKKKPLFAYSLALSHGNSEQEEEALRTIIARYKQPYMQHVYKTILALHQENISEASEHARSINKEPLKSYYAAYLAAKKGDFQEASHHEKNIRVKWMIHALHALYAREKRDIQTFQEEAEKAIEASRGIQKYILVYTYKKF